VKKALGLAVKRGMLCKHEFICQEQENNHHVKESNQTISYLNIACAEKKTHHFKKDQMIQFLLFEFCMCSLHTNKKI